MDARGLPGDGHGAFGAVQETTTESQYPFVALGDFDEDGTLDPATTSNALEVFRGNGDGTFAAPESYESGYNLDWLDAADLNGDGHLDIGGTTGGDTADVLLGVAAPALQAAVPGAASRRSGTLGPNRTEGRRSLVSSVSTLAVCCNLISRKRYRHHKHARVTVGHAKRTLKAGRRATVRVRFTRAARRRLRHAHRFSLRLQAGARVGRGRDSAHRTVNMRR